MNAPNRTTTTKSSNSTGNGGQVLREMSETSSTQTKQALEQVTAATADATTLMKDTYTVAVKHAQEYNGKFIEFARANTEAAFEFVHQVAGVKSPSETAADRTAGCREMPSMQATREQAGPERSENRAGGPAVAQLLRLARRIGPLR